MDVTFELEDDLAAAVTELASRLRRPPEWVIAQAIEHYIAEQERRTPTASDATDR